MNVWLFDPICSQFLYGNGPRHCQPKCPDCQYKQTAWQARFYDRPCTTNTPFGSSSSDEMMSSESQVDVLYESSNEQNQKRMSDNFADLPTFGLIASQRKDAWKEHIRKLSSSYSFLSLGARTAATFRQVGAVIQEWFKNIYDFCVGLFPESTQEKIRQAGFLGVLLNVFKDMYRKSADMFVRFFNTVRNYFKKKEADNLDHELSEAGGLPQDADSVVEEQAAGIKDFFLSASGKISKLYSRMIKLLMKCVNAFLDFKLPDASEVVKKVKDYMSFALLCDTIRNKDMFRASVDFIVNLVSGKHYYEDYTYLGAFHDAYKRINASCSADDLTISATTASAVTQEFARFEEAYKKIIIAFPAYLNTYKTMYDMLKQQVAKFRTSYYGSHRRVKPVVICLSGPSAVGKSAIQNKLIQFLPTVIMQMLQKNYRDHPDYDKMSQYVGQFFDKPSVWSRNCSQAPPEFDQDYANQTFVTYEELYTSTVSEVNMKWGARFFATIDDQALLMNTAFSDKGTVFFNSPFIIATSNATQHSIYVRDHDAYHRRIDMDFTVKRVNDQGVLLGSFGNLTPTAKKILRSSKTPHVEIPYKHLDKDFSVGDMLHYAARIYLTRLVNSFSTESDKLDIPEPTHDDHSSSESTASLDDFFPPDPAPKGPPKGPDPKGPKGKEPDVKPRRERKPKPAPAPVAKKPAEASLGNELAQQRSPAPVAEKAPENVQLSPAVGEDGETIHVMRPQPMGEKVFNVLIPPLEDNGAGVGGEPQVEEVSTSHSESSSAEELSYDDDLTKEYEGDDLIPPSEAIHRQEIDEYYDYEDAIRSERIEADDKVEHYKSLMNSFAAYEVHVAGLQGQRRPSVGMCFKYYDRLMALHEFKHTEATKAYAETVGTSLKERVEKVPMLLVQCIQSATDDEMRTYKEFKQEAEDFIHEFYELIVQHVTLERLATFCYKCKLNRPKQLADAFAERRKAKKLKNKTTANTIEPQAGSDVQPWMYRSLNVLYYSSTFMTRVTAVRDYCTNYGDVAHISANTRPFQFTPNCKGIIAKFIEIRHFIAKYTKEGVARVDGDPPVNPALIPKIPQVLSKFFYAIEQLRLECNQYLAIRAPKGMFHCKMDDRQLMIDAIPVMPSGLFAAYGRVVPWWPKTPTDINAATKAMKDMYREHDRRVKRNARRMTRVHRRIHEDRMIQSGLAQARGTVPTGKRSRTQHKRDRRIAKEGIHPQSGVPSTLVQPSQYYLDLVMRYRNRPWRNYFDKHPYDTDGTVDLCGRAYLLFDSKGLKFPGMGLSIYKTEYNHVTHYCTSAMSRFQVLAVMMWYEWARSRQRVMSADEARQIATAMYVARCKYMNKVPKRSRLLSSKYTMPGSFKAFCIYSLHHDWIKKYDFEYQMSSSMGDLIASAVVVSAAYAIVVPAVSYILTWLTGYAKQFTTYVVQGLDPKLVEKLNSYSATTGIILAQSGENKHAVPKVGKPVNVREKFEARIQKQDGSMNSLTNKLARNSYILTSEQGVQMGLATFVYGQIMQLNSHVYAALPKVFRMYATTATAGEKAYYDIDKSLVTVISDDPKADLIIVSCHGLVRSHNDLRGYITTEAEIKKYCYPSAAWVVTYDVNTMAMCMEPISEYTFATKRLVFEGTCSYLTDRLQYGWQNAAAGKCGTPVCAVINGTCKWTGVHRAGQVSTRTGYAALNTSERILKIEKKMDPIVEQCGGTISFSEVDPGFYELDIEKRAYVTPKKTSAVAQTVFVATPFQENKFLGGAPKIPAKLNSTAYKNALIKESSTVLDVSCKLEAVQIADQYKDEIMQKFCPVPDHKIMGCRTLTFEEAIDGFSDILDPFDLKTSEGLRLPLMGIRKENLRTPDHPDRVILKEFVEKRIEEYATSGSFTLQMNADCLKDELRDIERVSLNKTRLFNVTDFVDNVIMKMALGHLLGKLKKFLLLGPAMCGINPTSSTWSEIYRMFQGKPVVFTDISGWDHIAATWQARVILPWLAKCYGGHKTFAYRLAAAMYMAAMQAVRFNGGFGRRLNRGGSSGNWCTTFFNTINNHVFHSVAWFYLARKYGNESVSDYFSKFVLVLYSDDNISASDFPWWNVMEVAHTFKHLFGVTLTTTAKVAIDGSEQIATSTIDDADFLSRRFVNRDGIIYAPLSMDSLISQLYYVRSYPGADSAFLHDQLQQNLGNVARELMEYPAAQALELSNKIREFIAELQLPLVMPYYNYALTRGAAHKLLYY